MGMFRRAIEEYSSAIELDPQGAAAYCNRGRAYNQVGKYELAIEDCDKAIRLNPKGVRAYFNRGVAYADLGRQVKAAADFEKFIALADDPYWIGIARQRIDELEE